LRSPVWNEAKKNADLYNEILGKNDRVVIPLESPHNKHTYHIYAIRIQNRDDVIGTLAGIDIHCGIHYPIPLHLQEAYRSLGSGKGSFPVSEKVQAEFVSLPMFPELTREQIEYAADKINKLVAQKTPA
jgi:dTDP-4-amino-4,6-dideoxygalactose transaminase